jgi:hypothetical protein
MHKLAKRTMPTIIAVTLLILGTTAALCAGPAPPPPTVPEIDPSSSMAALALIAGAVLVIRGRRKK